MSLVKNLCLYIEDQTDLTIDTDLFVGGETIETPTTFAWVAEVPGSNETENGLEERYIQVSAVSNSYITTETLANTLYDVLNHKPGFSSALLSSENIFYCEPLTMPTPQRRQSNAGWVFTFLCVIRKY